jgi:hypothetical protein
MFVFGLLTGILIGGLYVVWFTRMLKKNGYLTFEITEKFHKKFKTKK